MYESQSSRSHPENGAGATKVADAAPLTLVAVGPDHRWVDLPAAAAELLRPGVVTFLRVGR